MLKTKAWRRLATHYSALELSPFPDIIPSPFENEPKYGKTLQCPLLAFTLPAAQSLLHRASWDHCCFPFHDFFLLITAQWTLP